jgi:diguanylate cyclase (GGDEF)-like protein
MKRLTAAIILIVFSLCLICGKILSDARDAAWQRAVDLAANVTASLDSDIARTVESYGLSLQGVIDGLAFPEITKVSPALRQAILFDRSATARHLDAIMFLDDKGIVRLDSRTPFPAATSLADSDFFRAHVDHPSLTFFVGRPFTTPATHHHVIGISRRLEHEDGSFAGVIVGTMKLSYLHDLLKDAALSTGGTVDLARTDGTVLMRWPSDGANSERKIGTDELFKRLTAAPNGHFETNAPGSGTRRLVTYRRIGDFPMVVSVEQSRHEIYAGWTQYALIVGSLIAVLFVMSIALTLYLSWEIRRRNAAETALVVLTRTDGLTEIANRRHLNDAIDREWRRAVREQKPLALVMADVDHFKAYNDVHGHQAGDNLLRAIGSAMVRSIRRGIDVAARYGGDEFAIILPGSSAGAAAQVAAQVRDRFTEICAQQGIAPASLSIGVASIVPSRQCSERTLLAAADAAAYAAKRSGRGRIEISKISPPPAQPSGDSADRDVEHAA